MRKSYPEHFRLPTEGTLKQHIVGREQGIQRLMLAAFFRSRCAGIHGNNAHTNSRCKER